MLSRVALILAVLAAFELGLTRPADAEEGPASRKPPTVIIRADVGVGSAVGSVGLALARAAGDYAQIEAGVGIGGSGVQLSLMPKLLFGSPFNHFICGAGLSLAVPTNPAEATGYPIWLNVDVVGFEHLSDNGFAFLIAAGLTQGLGNGRACGDVNPCDDPLQLKDVTRILLPQFRVGLGYSF